MQGLTTALVYTRVSTDEQAREGLSLDAQLAECRRYAAGHGWALGGEFQDVMTGTRDDRPQYQRLLAEVRARRGAGERVAVVVSALDRFGRKLLERVRARDELKDLSVPVHSVRENGEVSDLVANILAAVAEEEVRLVRERVRSTRRRMTDRGWYPSGVAPWGYRWRDATEAERREGAPKRVLDRDAEQAPFVSEMFERLVAGESVRSVCRWVAALPAHARGDGRRARQSSMTELVRSPVYVARQRLGPKGRKWPDRPTPRALLDRPVCRWPALVSDPLWLAAQDRLADAKRVPMQAGGQHLLTGFLRCPKCDRRMGGWLPPIGDPVRRQPRYHCMASNEYAACHYSVAAPPVDRQVLDEVCGLIDRLTDGDPETRRELVEAWEQFRSRHNDGAEQLDARRRRAEADLKRARERLRRAALLLVDGDLDRLGYDETRAGVERDMEAAARALAEVEAEETAASRRPAPPSLDDAIAVCGGWAEVLRSADVHAKREVLRLAVDRVVPHRLSQGRFRAEIAWRDPWNLYREALSREAV